jgi:catalase
MVMPGFLWKDQRLSPPQAHGGVRVSQPDPVVFLLDVDNTLLDNDQIIDDQKRHITQAFGVERQQRYWTIFEELRAEVGYTDYLSALQRYRAENPRDPYFLQISFYLLAYPFADRLFPAALDVIERIKSWGQAVIPSDGDPLASARGMAIKFHLPGGIDTDIVAESYDGFPVRTAEEFLVFVRALAASGPGVPSPKPIANFLASHHQAKRFAETLKPAPASFATESYYGVNAFRFNNRDGAGRDVRYRIRPEAGEAHLDAAEAAHRPGSFLFDELAERLSRGPARFHLLVQVAREGDPVGDGSPPWPEERPQVELGTIAVTFRAADSPASERRLLFDPARLVDGIELSDDPLPLARSAIDAIAYRRRNA